MRPVNVKNLNYQDRLKQKRRRSFILRIIGVVTFLTGGGIGIIYFLFFSNKLIIKDISLNGLKTLDSNIVLANINGELDHVLLKYFKFRRNILFVDLGDLKYTLLSNFAVVKDLEIRRQYWHGLIFNFIEREPVGVWCLKKDCLYFDKEGVGWGKATRSSGFLFLTINDQREDQIKIDKDFLVGVLKLLDKNLTGIIVKEITIPENSFNELRVYTNHDYYLIFSLDSDLEKQIEILKILLSKKAKDQNFNPQYIDLRIDGRIYYK